jgi:hypothetical protein
MFNLLQQLFLELFELFDPDLLKTFESRHLGNLRVKVSSHTVELALILLGERLFHRTTVFLKTQFKASCEFTF